MQNTVTKMESPTTQLKDPRLFREACYVNGQWVQAASGQSLNVDNPATGEIIGTVPKLSAAETRQAIEDRKSTRLNSSHQIISYAVFCLKKKKKKKNKTTKKKK